MHFDVFHKIHRVLLEGTWTPVMNVNKCCLLVFCLSTSGTARWLDFQEGPIFYEKIITSTLIVLNPSSIKNRSHSHNHCCNHRRDRPGPYRNNCKRLQWRQLRNL